MGLNLSEIHRVLGISKAMVFAYRGGKNSISAKSWRKLAAAEAAAGIVGGGTESASSSTNPKDFAPTDSADRGIVKSPMGYQQTGESSVVRDDVAEYRVTRKAESVEVRLERVEKALERMARMFEDLAESIRRKEKP